jgi:hypothetical protein
MVSTVVISLGQGSALGLGVGQVIERSLVKIHLQAPVLPWVGVTRDSVVMHWFYWLLI